MSQTVLEEKYCYKCKQTKYVGDFAICRRSKDGLQEKCKTCSAKTVRLWYRKNKNRAYEATKRSQARHPEKYRAGCVVRMAVMRGTITKKPCEVCGDNNVHAHHEDYSKPREVVWLCRKHHVERHYPPRAVNNQE